MSKTASHAQKATQYFKIQACGATKWSRMPGFLEYLDVVVSRLTALRKKWYNLPAIEVVEVSVRRSK